MIAESKEVKEWDLQINLEPDQIEAKVLKRPALMIYPTPQPLLSAQGLALKPAPAQATPVDVQQLAG